MAPPIKQTNKKVAVDRKYYEELQRKASFFEEILSIIEDKYEDKYLGELIKKQKKKKIFRSPELSII